MEFKLTNEKTNYTSDHRGSMGITTPWQSAFNTLTGVLPFALGAASSCSTFPLLDRLLFLSLLCKLLVISLVFSCGRFLSLGTKPRFSHPTSSSWTTSSTSTVSITKYAHEFLTLGSLFWAPDRHILLLLPTRYICFGLNCPKLCLAPKLSHSSHLLLLPGPQFVQD